MTAIRRHQFGSVYHAGGDDGTVRLRDARLAKYNAARKVIPSGPLRVSWGQQTLVSY